VKNGSGAFMYIRETVNLMPSRDQASTLYREGNLGGAIEAQLAWVRGNPTDIGARLFLFELLAFDGQWERAERQAQALLTNDAESDTAVGMYQKCILSERKRAASQNGEVPPRILGASSQSIELRLEALKEGVEVASRLILQAEELESNRQNPDWILNGRAVKSLRDGDDLLGPVLEVFAQGEYFWIDVNEIQLLETEPPKYPRDLIWLPARLETKSESGNVFLPMIYCNSSAVEDVALRLGRATDWVEKGESGIYRGIGLKDWILDDSDNVPLIDFRSLVQGSGS
jgi:type VI secretion system protein ImpE